MDALGIEIRNDAWALAHVKGSPFGVKTDDFCLISGKDSLERLRGLKDYIAARGLKNPSIAVTLSRSASISKMITVPAPDERALKSILKFEAEKHIPMTAECAYHGYEIINRSKKIFTVLLSATRKDTADNLLHEFRSAELPLDGIYPWHASFINAMHRWKRALVSGKNIAFIGINRDDVSIDVFSGLIPAYCGTIAAHSLVGQEEISLMIKRELKFSLSSLTERRIDECVITSDNSTEKDLEFVSGLFGEVNVPVSAAWLQCAGMPPSAAPALGAAVSALGKGLIELNLAPSAARGKPLSNTRRASLVAAASFMFVFTGVSYLAKDWLALRKTERVISVATAEKDKVQNAADTLKAMDEKIRILEDIRSGSMPGSLETLKELTEVLPSDTWLTGFEYSGDLIYLEGFSERASSLLIRLEKSVIMKDTEFTGPVTKNPQGKEHFRIKSRLKYQSDEASGRKEP